MGKLKHKKVNLLKLCSSYVGHLEFIFKWSYSKDAYETNSALESIKRRMDIGKKKKTGSLVVTNIFE